eukprot:3806258-Rhodomonas_salina.1
MLCPSTSTSTNSSSLWAGARGPLRPGHPGHPGQAAQLESSKLRHQAAPSQLEIDFPRLIRPRSIGTTTTSTTTRPGYTQGKPSYPGTRSVGRAVLALFHDAAYPGVPRYEVSDDQPGPPSRSRGAPALRSP